MFNVDSYRRVIQSGADAGYTYLPFSLERRKGRCIYLRHDIDYSIEYALRIAELDAELGVSATFFLQLQSEIYNALSQRSLQFLEQIHRLGHRIGLHVRLPQNGTVDLEDHVKREWALLRMVFPVAESVFSWHTPTENLIREFENYPVYAGLINAYAAPFLKDAKYLSDSNLRNSAPQFVEAISGREHEAIQLLLHPVNWVAGGSTMGEILANTWGQVIRERDQDIKYNSTYRKQLPEGMPVEATDAFSRNFLRLITDGQDRGEELPDPPMSASEFKYKEAALRIGPYVKDVATEQFQDQLNITLSKLEPRGLIDPDASFPILFVVGLPRSGSTLLTQIFSSALDIGYINNLIARFWSAPVTGIRLSQILLGSKRPTHFESNYGKTKNLEDPHEFSYFWHEWFHMHHAPPYDSAAAAERIDWCGFRDTLRNMAAEFGKPMTMKGAHVAYHLVKVAELIPETIFLFIRRDLAEIAASLRQGRLKYYGNPNTWLGFYPLEYEQIVHFRDHEQIARQVFYLDKMIERGMALIPEHRKLVINLEELRASPTTVLERVRGTIERNKSKAPDIISRLPDTFPVSTHAGKEDYQIFQGILERLEREHEAEAS